MRTIIAVLLLALSVAVTGSAKAADRPVSHAPLRAADCIDTSNINEWKIVDERTAIVRTGPKRYLVTLKSSCPQLSHPPGLMFNTRPSGGANQGRICGDIGETVRTRGQPACPIESVSIIDKAKFSQLSEDAKRYANKQH
ncbi:MAG TPA: DUF6491 family protein [Rhodanobacter sp.]